MRIKAFLLAMVASTPSLAADLPAKAPPLSATTPLSSIGLYLGVNAGAGFSGQQYDFVTLPGVATGTGKIYPAGVMSGLTLGIGGSAGPSYLAAESDWDYDFTKFETSCLPGRCGARNSWFFAQKIVWGLPMSSITGAIPKTSLTPPSQWPIPLSVPSNLSMSNIMPFITGGIAERNVDACISGFGCGSQWMAGPLVGGGVRTAISQNWSTKVEYNAAFFNKSFTPSSATPLFPATFKALPEQRIMIGADYHF